MSVTFYDSAFPGRAPLRDRAAPTLDLESTTDLHEECTSDLAPATEDIDPAMMMKTPERSDEPEREQHFEPAQAKRIGTATAQSSGNAKPKTAESAQPKTTETARPETTAPVMAKPQPAPPTPTPARKPAPMAKPAPPPTPTLGPGTVLAERYLLEQAIGIGGTAIVYRARDMQSSSGTAPNEQVAIKLPRPELRDRARALARLKHEFQHAKSLSHPNIVRMDALHCDAQHCFIAMELIEGKLLSHIVRDWTMLAQPLAHKILRSCAQALTYAHGRNVIHGDFKPANVFVTADETVKIVDFGAAASSVEENGSRIPAATFAYASPQVLSGQPPEQRDDVFSFACVAYELLTGQHPFEYRSSLVARDEGRIPPRAWSLSASQWLALLSALAWEREQRPADVETLLAALTPQTQPVAETAPVYAAPEAAVPSELPSELMPQQRSWGFFIFIACALIVTIIAATQRRGEDAPANVPQRDSAAERPSVTAPGADATQLPAVTDGGAPSDAASSTAAARTAASGTAASGNTAANDATSGDTAPSASLSGTAQKATAAGRTGGSTAPKATARKPTSTKPAPASVPIANAPARLRQGAASISEISFESRAVVTSEGSVAAVFLVKRSQPLSGRARVQWTAVSGTADAGIDFASNATGTIEFADGQAQRAIYVPLRNDLLKEGNEKFTVRLQSPQQARLGSLARAEATIRDDD